MLLSSLLVASNALNGRSSFANQASPTRFISTLSAFPDSEHADLITALPMYVDSMSEDMGLDYTSVIAKTIEEAEQELFAYPDSTVMLQFTDLIRKQEPWSLVPKVCIIQGGHDSEQLYVLSHQSNQELSSLRNARIVVSESQEFPRYYLESLTDAIAGQTPEDFFGVIESEKKQVNSVFTTVRRKADACLVTRFTYESMQSLSPQLIQRLSIVAKSPEYPRAVLAFTDSVDIDRQEKVLKFIVSDFKNTPRGRQLLLMFRVDGFATYHQSTYVHASEIVNRFGA